MNPNVAGQICRKLAVCFEQESAFVLVFVQFPSREKTKLQTSLKVSVHVTNLLSKWHTLKNGHSFLDDWNIFLVSLPFFLLMDI